MNEPLQLLLGPHAGDALTCLWVPEAVAAQRPAWPVHAWVQRRHAYLLDGLGGVARTTLLDGWGAVRGRRLGALQLGAADHGGPTFVAGPAARLAAFGLRAPEPVHLRVPELPAERERVERLLADRPGTRVVLEHESRSDQTQFTRGWLRPLLAWLRSLPRPTVFLSPLAACQTAPPFVSVRDLNLREMGLLIQRSDLFISVGSGLMHAGALNWAGGGPLRVEVVRGPFFAATAYGLPALRYYGDDPRELVTLINRSWRTCRRNGS